MAARLSKIYTKTGDDGTTAVRAEVRLSKSDPLIELIGSLDELNSMIGELISLPIENGVDEDENENEHKHYNTLLFNIQHQLFNLGGELCMPEYPGITQKDIQFLETEIDAFNTQLPPLKEFILPGGSMKAAKCFSVRAFSRRVERVAVHYQNLSSTSLKYLNRLSDFLFVLSRIYNLKSHTEIYWNSRRLQKLTSKHHPEEQT